MIGRPLRQKDDDTLPGSLQDRCQVWLRVRALERRSEGKGNTEMIYVTVKVREGTLAYLVCHRPSIERALAIIGEVKLHTTTRRKPQMWAIAPVESALAH